MIKHKNEIETVTVENQGNIAGIINKEVILTPAEMLDKAYMFNVINLPSGSQIKEHPHFPDAEIYYILKAKLWSRTMTSARCCTPVTWSSRATATATASATRAAEMRSSWRVF